MGKKYEIDEEEVMGYIKSHNQRVRSCRKDRIVSYIGSDSNRIECAKVLIGAVKELDEGSIVLLRDYAKGLMGKKN